MRGDPLEHVAQIRPRIDAVGLTCCHEAVENRGALPLGSLPQKSKLFRPVTTFLIVRSETLLSSVSAPSSPWRVRLDACADASAERGLSFSPVGC
jgi:hypothetical protein